MVLDCLLPKSYFLSQQFLKFVVSHLFLYLSTRCMRDEGNNETEKPEDKPCGRLSISLKNVLPLEIPVSFNVLDQMFYHRFRTSNELCSAGLFTVDTYIPSKKHRRMKCKLWSLIHLSLSFCNSVMCGWRDKFCRHLDRCPRAQNVFLLLSICCSSILLLIRSTPNLK